MHEMSIAENILTTVSNTIKSEKIKNVSKIFISIGQLSGVEKHSLAYSFELLPKNPPFTETVLIIKEVPITIYCSTCTSESQIQDSYSLHCQSCGKLSSDIVKGKELTIDTIEY